MLTIQSKTFNPEVLYVFDAVNKGPSSGIEHAHNFFELSILLRGESFYVIDNESYYLNEPTILIFNPGVSHMEYVSENMENLQMHIGLRHFNFPGFQRNFVPLSSKIVKLGEYDTEFFAICEKIIQERRQAKFGYELILKSLVNQLLVYLLRDGQSNTIDSQLDPEELERQRLVNDIKLFIENHYHEDLTLDQIADSFYISPATLSRTFKEFMGDTPINFLIHHRLEQSKNLIVKSSDLTIKEIAENVGYKDPLYFSKLFKKHYGESPTFFRQE